MIQLDTLDDRREIWHLLHRLSPASRVAFLRRWCDRIRAANKHGNGPAPMGFDTLIREANRCERGNERLTNTVYCDLVAASAQWELDLVAVAADLEAEARGRGHGSHLRELSKPVEPTRRLTVHDLRELSKA